MEYGLLCSEGGEQKMKFMRFTGRRTIILGAFVPLFLFTISAEAGAGTPIPNVPGAATNSMPSVSTNKPAPPTNIPGGLPGGIGTINPNPMPPGGVGLPGAPSIDPTTGIPIPGGGLPGAGGAIPGGGATVSTNSPQPQVQEIVTPEMMEEAMRVFVRESKVIRDEAEAGNPRQQHNLAVLYTLGLGVPLDHQKAFSWFNKAANEGLAESQFNVAIALQGGLGTRKDMVTSYKYYILCSSQGLPNAAVARDHLAQYLNREQIEAGQRMARGFLRNLERRRYYKDLKERETKRMQAILEGKNPNESEKP